MQLDSYKRLLALANAGLFYAKDAFDKERYGEIKEISLNLLNDISLTSLEELVGLTSHDTGHPTPKVDVRAFIMANDKLLLVEEAITKEWSLPGGFAEIGLSPKENIVKGEFVENLETSNCQFFSLDDLPQLSEKRTTKQQLMNLLSTNSCYVD